MYIITHLQTKHAKTAKINSSYSIYILQISKFIIVVGFHFYHRMYPKDIVHSGTVLSIGYNIVCSGLCECNDPAPLP